MKDKYKFGLILALTVLMATAATVMALGQLEPTTTWNVTPVNLPFTQENRGCSSELEYVEYISEAFPSVTEGTDGTYTEDFLIDGQTVTVAVTTHSDNSFDFEVTNGVMFELFVKGSEAADSGFLRYQYVPTVSGATNTGPVTGDTGLHDGYKDTNPDSYQDVSHLEFCIVAKGDPLTATKTAVATYDEHHYWSVSKSVDPLSQWGWAGDFLDWTWTVDVDEYGVDENFEISGVIEIGNTNSYPVPFVVTDYLDTGAAVGVTCPSSEVPANGTLTCTYETHPTNHDAVMNTATIESLDFRVDGTTAEAAVNWEKTVINGTAVIDDDQEPDFPLTLNAGEGPWQFTEAYDHTCSIEATDYTLGSYSGDQDNTVVLTPSNDEAMEDSASTSYTCYAPVVSKTAAGSYDEHHTWDIEKSVDPMSQHGFAGDTLAWEWLVTVTEEQSEDNFDISGSISIGNPHPDESMTVAVADVLGDDTVVDIDLEGCTNSIVDGDLLVIPAGQTAICAYGVYDLDYEPASSAPTRNTVTVTLNEHDFLAFADFSWIVNVFDDTAGVADDQESDFPITITEGQGPWKWTEVDEHICSDDIADYGLDGSYSETIYNTATVTGSHGNTDTASASTTYTCHAPLVSKTAKGTYDETHKWNIEKSVNPDTQSGIAGDTLPWTYTVHIWQSYTDSNFVVKGDISIANPAPMPMPVTLVDALEDGSPGMIHWETCTFSAYDAGVLTIEAGQTAVCEYTVDKLTYATVKTADTKNIATVTLNAIDFTGDATFAWVPNVINGTATFTDPKFNHTETLDAAEGPWEDWTFVGSHICSIDASLYDDGQYTGDDSNTAYLDPSDGEQLSDSASTAYTCYAPTITKDAEGSYKETHTWEIFKTVTPNAQRGYPGDRLDWTWEVIVEETVTDSDFGVTGQITVHNPAPVAMVVMLSDELSDGTVADITGCTGGDFNGDLNYLTLSAGGTAVCDYQATPVTSPIDHTNAPTENTAELEMSVSTSGLDPFVDSATVTIPWIPTVIDPAVDLVDDNYPFFDKEGIDEYLSQTLSEYHICSTNRWDYGETGTYINEFKNLAELYIGERLIDDAFAKTKYICKASFVNVTKLTNGEPNWSQTWSFELSQGGTKLESLTTPPPTLEFQTALRPDGETIYTMCETGIPAGWSVQWALDTNANGVIDDGETLSFVGPEWMLIPDGTLQVYDPDPYYGTEDAVNDTRCVNFKADEIPGGVVSFIIDNSYPGGDPRTPGYWKNWNTCTGGNQQYTAAANGGIAEGFWLLDDVLPTVVGSLPVVNCNDAVNLLDKRDLEGAKHASYPAFNLTTALLAAKANVAAGAEVCPALFDAIADADELLIDVGFNGLLNENDKKGYWFPKKEAGPVNALAETLDLYNNGLLCNP